ncbi:GNAT family N-acetyltransferase [Pseudomonas thivervalensis]|uniref:GNAT family N-acetyltransferase n=1 Tax=Pseudomonas thivervalensis TaxID=86265 RepID=UPI00069FFC08|nr:GNAT family N-acetyltransferase [Pseudomonas thivervalensis]OAB54773.1 acetyltransferase [Pseudomonas thivervalensis]SDF37777.1 ribosomal-protein-alanine N-acetyltransferase [Pseudomonas thivervalensis]
MKPFRIRELEMTDVQALLAFEIHNREWFESHIDARAPAFYSWAGVTDHIESYLADFAKGAWHPFVIEDSSGRIVGRANLKGIHSPHGCAEVGYRIDQRVCGQGLATQALKHLIQAARMRWGLTGLVAYVYENNVGSRKVLERCGFVPGALSGGEEIEGGCRFTLSI